MYTHEERYRAVARAWDEDAEYRALMERDPKAALAAGGVAVKVDEVRLAMDTDEVRHVVFPPDPNSDLSDEQLRAVAGGASLRGCFDLERACYRPG